MKKHTLLQNDSHTPYSQNSYLKLSEHICSVFGGGYSACLMVPEFSQ